MNRHARGALEEVVKEWSRERRPVALVVMVIAKRMLRTGTE